MKGLKSQIEELILSNEVLQKEKVTLEIRAVELEEKNELFQEEALDLKNKLEMLRTTIKVRTWQV